MDIAARDSRTLSFMNDFTKTYQATSGHFYAREIECLKLQMRFSALPPRKGDLLVGRRLDAPIGFLPQSSGGMVGYYCDRNALRQMYESDAFTPGEKKQLLDLMNFWDGKTTKDKIYAQYSDEQKTELTHGDFNTEPGFGFPLYRMSGAQMNPEKLLHRGIGGLIGVCEKNRSKSPDFFDAMKAALLLLQDLCLQYAEVCKEQAEHARDTEKENLLQMAENLRQIASSPAKTFWQAMQLAYLFFVFSGTFNYGRMDDYLGPYYVHDLENGTLSQDFALQLTTNLWQLMNERETTWDARVILGGKGRSHPQEADRFARLAIETSRRVRDTLPQLTLRCYKGMDSSLYEQALQCIGEGTTYPILYNDDVDIPSVQTAFAVDEKTAEQYVPFGCGEYVIYNQSIGTPSGAINLLYGLNEILYGKKSQIFSRARSFEELYAAYMQEVKHMVLLLAQQEKIEYDVCAEESPFLLYSLLFDDCLSKGKPLFSGGIRYLGGTLETYGNINVSDSLTAIKQLVYNKPCLSAEDLQTALAQNFVGYDDLRSALLQAPKYGNDLEAADQMAVRFHDDLCHLVQNTASQVGLHTYLPVLINNSMNTTFGVTTGASADGRLANTYMANANNPMSGMDTNGITSMLNSLVKLDTHHHAGAVQNMRFSKEMFAGLIEKNKALLSCYFENGGAQTMITVLGCGDLEAAMAHPEQYPNLIVRVGGFSARFIELSHDVQLELLNRTLY